MTKKLYLTGDQTACDAQITGLGTNDRGQWVQLDQTVAYPQGGGQKCDRGTIGGVPFSKVAQEDGEVFHYPDDQFAFVLGQTVRVEIDPEWRSLQARWHNAGHVLAALLEEQFPGLKAVAGHHWPGEARIEAVATSFPDPSNVQATLDVAIQETIAHDLPVKVVGDPNTSRAIQIGDYPPVPCGGTHPRSTGALGVVQVRAVKIKAGKLRLSYELKDAP